MSAIPDLSPLDNGSIVVFDTDCLLFSRWVYFLLAHEQDQELVFVRAWSSIGLALAARYGLTRADLSQTYLVIENGRGISAWIFG